MFLITKETLERYQLDKDVLDSERVNRFIIEAQDLDLKPLLGDVLFYELCNSYKKENITVVFTGLSGPFTANEVINGKEGATVVATGILVSQTANQVVLANPTGDWDAATALLGVTSAATANKAAVVYGKYYKLINGDSYLDSQNNTINFPGIEPVLVYFTFARFIKQQPGTITSFGYVEKLTPYSRPVSATVVNGNVQEARSGALAYFSGVVKYLADNSTVYPLWLKTAPKQISGGIRISRVNRFHHESDQNRRRVDCYDPCNTAGSGTSSSGLDGATRFTTLNVRTYAFNPELVGHTLFSVLYGNFPLSPGQFIQSGYNVIIIDELFPIAANVPLQITFN